MPRPKPPKISAADNGWPSSAATAILIALVLLDGQPFSAALILGGFGLGIAFLKAEFSYTASWRQFLTRGEAGGLLGGLIVIVIAALVIVPTAALKSNFGGAIAPLGPSLLIGAFVFRSEAGGLLGGLIVIVIAALVIVPTAALKSNFGGAIAPLGPSLLIGAFVF